MARLDSVVRQPGRSEASCGEAREQLTTQNRKITQHMKIKELKEAIASVPDDAEAYIKGTCDVFVQRLEGARTGDVDGETSLVLIPEVEVDDEECASCGAPYYGLNYCTECHSC
jgi:hypothetical protein